MFWQKFFCESTICFVCMTWSLLSIFRGKTRDANSSLGGADVGHP
jgi:hypothetical protein